MTGHAEPHTNHVKDCTKMTLLEKQLVTTGTKAYTGKLAMVHTPTATDFQDQIPCTFFLHLSMKLFSFLNSETRNLSDK